MYMVLGSLEEYVAGKSAQSSGIGRVRPPHLLLPHLHAELHN
jgi:hypothetical protein